jgi:transposase-like protein
VFPNFYLSIYILSRAFPVAGLIESKMRMSESAGGVGSVWKCTDCGYSSNRRNSYVATLKFVADANNLVRFIWNYSLCRNETKVLKETRDFQSPFLGP